MTEATPEQQESAPADEQAAPQGDRLFAAAVSGSGTLKYSAKPDQSWMITFTDLVALMLTFFVLMFSMSRIDQVQWQNLTDALSRSLDQVAEPREPKPAKQLDIQRIAYRPGGDLDYLSAVLRDHMAEQEALASAYLARRPGQLIIALPAGLLFGRADGQEVIHDEGRRALFVIGGLVSKLGNRIEVAGHRLPGRAKPSRVDWLESLHRAELVSEVLAASGYGTSILVRGYGATRSKQLDGLDDKQFQRLADRIDIIVHNDAGEAP